MLAENGTDQNHVDAHAADVVFAARQHPEDMVRAEAVAALGRQARTRHGGAALTEVARCLCSDGAGRVRYAAIQTLRLAVEAGSTGIAVEAAVQHTDDDFGVLFERELVRTATRDEG
jgi:HEAT repeat protein